MVRGNFQVGYYSRTVDLALILYPMNLSSGVSGLIPIDNLSFEDAMICTTW